MAQIAQLRLCYVTVNDNSLGLLTECTGWQKDRNGQTKVVLLNTDSIFVLH